MAASRKSKRSKWIALENYSDLPLLSRFYIWLFGSLFSHIKYYKKNVETTRRCLKKGAVVHVQQYRSYLDYLILNYFLKQHDLPPVAFSEPNFMVRLIKGFSQTLGLVRRSSVNTGDVASSQYLFFLQHRGKFLSVKAATKVELLENLLQIQSHQEEPIFLIPQLTIWSKRPISVKRSWLDIFFGNPYQPGRIRKLIIFLRNYRQAFVRYGEPIDLSEWITGTGKRRQPKDNSIRELRWQIFQYFTEERVAVTGPSTRPRTWVLESVMKSAPVVKVMRELAAEEQVSIEEIELRSAKILSVMSADYRYSFIVFGDWVMSMVFRRIFSPIVVDKKGFERIRELLKKHPVIFTPSHKSHIDYLIFSSVMFNQRMAPPHIIAGENLSFFPMGYFFRHMGAIFIRRSFGGDRLYQVLLKTYLNHMLEARYSQEFFIEGGRSRTGKLLLPRLGILSIYVDGFLQNPSRDIMIQPISINYSKLIEQGSYSRELEGGEKKKESTGQLMSLWKVLKLRYGGLYLNAGDAISLKDYIESQVEDISDVDERERRKIVKSLGDEIIYRINQAATVTASSLVALALLSTGKRGVTQSDLVAKVEFILQYLKDNTTARFTEELSNPLWAVSDTLNMLKRDGNINIHQIGKETIYTINESKRLSLDFYKNNIIHFFMSPAMLALAFLSCNSKEVSKKDLRERTRFLAGLFSFEFVFDQDSTFQEKFNTLLEQFTASGILVDSGSKMKLGQDAEDSVSLFASAIRNFLESYWVVARVLPALMEKRMNQSRFMELVMEEGKKLSLMGEIKQVEAYSKNNFKNGMQYLIQRGVLVKYENLDDTTIVMLPRDQQIPSQKSSKQKKKSARRDYRLGLSQEYSSPEAIKAVVDELQDFLGDFEA